jgi:hypothetical protein
VDSTQTYLKNGANIHVSPGDTVFFKGGNWHYIMLENFKGTSDSAITFMNYNGKVRIHNTHYFGINVKNCDHIHLTGTGDDTIPYGIHISQVTQGGGIGFGSLSNHFEIDHFHIENTLLAGIYAKTDPDISFASSRDSFLMEDVYIHHNFFNDIGDEGLYIGSTKYFGQLISFNGSDTLVLPHLLKNVDISFNQFYDIGWDAIQLSSAALGDNRIHDNYIIRDSKRMTFNQMSGIMVGGGTKADVYNNYIQDGKGSGMVIASLGGQRIFNNVIINAGQGFYPDDQMMMQHGIYIGDISMEQDSSLFIFNNTIVHPKSDCIRFTSLNSANNVIANNALIDPGNYEFYDSLHTSFTKIDAYIMISDQSISIDTFNNYYHQNVFAMGFSDAQQNNFTLINSSVLIDKGSSDPRISCLFDHYNNQRPIGLSPDIGAFEFNALTVSNSGNNAYQSNSLSIHPNPCTNQLVVTLPSNCDSMPKLMVYSMRGELQEAKFKFQSDHRTIHIITNNLNEGMYLLHIEAEGVSYSTKFLIKR